MFDRITQLIFACACLAVAFGAMNITLASENSEIIDIDAIKCEVTSELLKRWVNTDDAPRYIHVEVGEGSFIDGDDDFFCSNGWHGSDCAFPASRERSKFHANGCNLEVAGIIDTRNPNAYTSRTSIQEDEQLLSLAFNYVMISEDGTRAKMLISRQLSRSSTRPHFLLYSSIVTAQKTTQGWAFSE